MFNFTVFYQEFFPKIRDYAGNFNLQSADCEDISQDVMKDFWQKVQDGRANPYDIGVKGYLFKLARWRITDKARSNIRREKEFVTVGGENNLDELAAQNLDTSWQQEILIKATKSIKNSVSRNYYKYFVHQVFGQKDAEQMFKIFGVKKSHAYLAKHRVGLKVIAAAKEMIKNHE